MVKPNKGLKELRYLLAEGGLLAWIGTFRNPCLEAITQHQTTYHAQTDSLREHHYVYCDPPYEYDYEFCHIRYFSNELTDRLGILKNEVCKYILYIKAAKKLIKRESLIHNLYNEIVVIATAYEQISVHRYHSIIQSFFDDLFRNFHTEAVQTPRGLSFKYNLKGKRALGPEDERRLQAIYFLNINSMDLINRDKTEWEDFLNVFTAKDIHSLMPNHQIFFDCTTKVAAYVLRKMEPLFNNLSFSKIAESNRFYSKKGKLIIGTDLYTGLTRGNKRFTYHDEIDSFFKMLENQ